MIQKLEHSDIDQIITIWLEASIKAHDFVPKEFWQSKTKDMREIYLPAAETYVYKDKGTVKGFISLYNDSIAAIFVAPCYQGTGIGSQLMGKAKSICNSLTLAVYKENTKSVEFYKRHGFMIEQEQIDKHTGHMELIMKFSS